MTKIFASKTNDIEEREIKHADIARNLAGECMVLLKNDGVLPLMGEKKIALYGNGARHTVKGGTGSGDVNTRQNTNIEQGFMHAGFEITSLNWLDRQDEKIKQSKLAYKEACERIASEKQIPITIVGFDYPYTEPAPEQISLEDVSDAHTQTAVYVIARNSGEGADRFDKEGDYQLYKQELENLKLLTAHYKNTVVVLNIGGVMNLSEISEMKGIGAILLMTQLGNIGGDALLDVLTGKVNPSGKTVDTWARHYMDYPSSEKFSHNESVHDELYEDDIYMGYRYFDSFDVKPLYPFGYGLSYTDFSISNVRTYMQKDKIKVCVTVKNTGAAFAGKETIQVYYSAPGEIMDTPYQELCAYKKTSLLSPGMEETLEIDFPIKSMASYVEEKAAWVLEKGNYILRVGNSSVNTKPVAVIEVKEEIKTEAAKNLFALDMELHTIKPDKAFVQNKKLANSPADISHLCVDAKDLQTKVMHYQTKRTEYMTQVSECITAKDVLDGRYSLEEMVAQLSVEEMASLCVGTLRMGENKSIVGNASSLVPGAAGDTSSVLFESRGVRNLILADGPAGLRLQPHFKTTKDGKLLPGGEVMGEFTSPFDESANEENSIDYYQYCTAIPIGWALAQSWNEELLYEVGDMIGSEMEQFHVDLWLAPAMNIHRNPLCGRNFEYYSEDPLVSGKTAAAITRGVQSHAGKGTTIKHFAVNNQEDNRYFVNAHVSERALREIYLKGFEIAVKESQPFSIMTSYNLLNGIHTANHHDLIQAIARDEWGFEGTVMTDWFTSQNMPMLTGKFTPKYPISASTGCIYAGNDIQMPGCQKNVDDIVDAVTLKKEIDGFGISKADLQFNAANMLRIVLKCMK